MFYNIKLTILLIISEIKFIFYFIAVKKMRLIFTDRPHAQHNYENISYTIPYEIILNYEIFLNL